MLCDCCVVCAVLCVWGGGGREHFYCNQHTLSVSIQLRTNLYFCRGTYDCTCTCTQTIAAVCAFPDVTSAVTTSVQVLQSGIPVAKMVCVSHFCALKQTTETNHMFPMQSTHD